ncbi:MAG: bifunctional proline dehydrogenase/L-glutamate gamma-semialdehyde dehydrogenase PutA [Alphaproteobacteria bacterium]|nr:MAG: bifunctional proline dehydrogenase/L-glutamate gamma-semialdehyde dehydrogenase PutA [Alphaproteobacteria bacterium]
MDERRAVRGLLAAGSFTPAARSRIDLGARRLVRAIRRRRKNEAGLESFLAEYSLSTHEGVALMCLAEALLRIPDAATADRLIEEKIGGSAWARHLGQSDSLLVNASTWGLMLTGEVVRLGSAGRDFSDFLGRLIARSGEPVIRQAVRAAVRIIGRQFVMGRTIEEARGRTADAPGLRYSFDMLGEAAMTAGDAERYFQRYAQAIADLEAHPGPGNGPGGLHGADSLSVKLSALHPRFEFAQAPRAVGEVAERLGDLAQRAAAAGIGLTVDAEEAARLEPTLDVVEAVAARPGLAGWDGLGLCVQAYQRRAPAVIDWLVALAGGGRRRFCLRLVKGAYWDTEIKAAQEAGLDGYPVFTRKSATDLSYLACARKMFAQGDALYPQFATHNAHTVAAVIELASEAGVAKGGFEFQRLHGMGEALYGHMAAAGRHAAEGGHPLRIYAPVGSHQDLLPYLVRRLLENGANTSFVNRINDASAPLARLVGDPAVRLKGLMAAGAPVPHPRICAPRDLFAPERPNSRGLDLADPGDLGPLADAMTSAARRRFEAAPLIGGRAVKEGAPRPVGAPADQSRQVGRVWEARAKDVEAALCATHRAAPDWAAVPAAERAACLDRAADAMEADAPSLVLLLVHEGGKTIADGLAEVREAVDFCRYYAARARADFAEPSILPGITGEENSVALTARGVFACISPWNFPLAIFMGQVSAALAAGNAVIAKPAEQTPLVAQRAVGHLIASGVPAGALALLPGSGQRVGGHLVRDHRVNGVAFTGGTETAARINRALAAREGAIIPLIAETGGLNAMIVDSSALAEQVVGDVLRSAFGSAGQRCSGLRLLVLQDDVADRTLKMLAGAMAELVVGDPARLTTDVGPIIDREARAGLRAYSRALAARARLIARTPLPAGLDRGHWFAPVAYEIGPGDIPQREVFGPVLHVLRFSAKGLDRVLDRVAATGYGLTLGIHSRIEATWARVRARVPAGNVYVNRAMTGAVVGSQPFGGEGLSGTGPKAGGRHYLPRFATERTLSVNTAAAGGNASLFASLEEPGPGPIKAD